MHLQVIQVIDIIFRLLLWFWLLRVNLRPHALQDGAALLQLSLRGRRFGRQFFALVELSQLLVQTRLSSRFGVELLQLLLPLSFLGLAQSVSLCQQPGLALLDRLPLWLLLLLFYSALGFFALRFHYLGH